MSRGEAEREGDTELEAGSRLSCQHRARRRARTHGPQDHDLSRSQKLNRLSHPGATDLLFANVSMTFLLFFHVNIFHFKSLKIVLITHN